MMNASRARVDFGHNFSKFTSFPIVKSKLAFIINISCLIKVVERLKLRIITGFHICMMNASRARMDFGHDFGKFTSFPIIKSKSAFIINLSCLIKVVKQIELHIITGFHICIINVSRAQVDFGHDFSIFL